VTQKPQDFLTYEELWGLGTTDDVRHADALNQPNDMWDAPETDTLIMNDWPLYHVFIKWARWYWDPDKQKNVLVEENEALFIRAPKPGLVMDYPDKIAALTGDEIVSWDAAYIPEED